MYANILKPRTQCLANSPLQKFRYFKYLNPNSRLKKKRAAVKVGGRFISVGLLGLMCLSRSFWFRQELKSYKNSW